MVFGSEKLTSNLRCKYAVGFRGRIFVKFTKVQFNYVYDGTYWLSNDSCPLLLVTVCVWCLNNRSELDKSTLYGLKISSDCVSVVLRWILNFLMFAQLLRNNTFGHIFDKYSWKLCNNFLSWSIRMWCGVKEKFSKIHKNLQKG